MDRCPLKLLMILFFPVFVFIGCATPKHAVRLDEGNVKRLTERSDAQAARKAAPEWCRDALKTINYLETRNKILDAREDDK